MERRTLLGRLSWQLGEVVATQPETARTKSITLTVPNWMGHRAGQHVDVRLTAEDVIYRDELDQLVKNGTMFEVVQTLTRVQPPGWTGYARRIDTQMLREVAWSVEQRPLAFICGPTPFVKAASASLVDLGYGPAHIKTERFGPTGET